MDKIPIYATLLYEVRKKLDITWTEYVYLDMIYHLSHDGWCYKSLANIGKDIGLEKTNVYRMRNRLIEKGLIEKNAAGHTKTTKKYTHYILLWKTQEKESAGRSQNAYDRSQNAYDAVVKTHTKNNNKKEREIIGLKNESVENYFNKFYPKRPMPDLGND